MKEFFEECFDFDVLRLVVEGEAVVEVWELNALLVSLALMKYSVLEEGAVEEAEARVSSCSSSSCLGNDVLFDILWDVEMMNDLSLIVLSFGYPQRRNELPCEHSSSFEDFSILHFLAISLTD